MVTLGTVIIILLIGSLIFFFTRKHYKNASTAMDIEQIQVLTTNIKVIEEREALQNNQISKLENEKQSLQQNLDTAKDITSNLETELRVGNANLASEKEKLEELKAQFETQKNNLKTEFRSLSEEIMKDRQETLTQQNKEGVGALIKPLKEQIEGFQKRINEVHTETTKGNTNLESEIRKVMQLGIQMRDGASDLTSALKGDSQQRGAWGESQLERTLEMSGLIKDAHYAKQTSFKDPGGRQKQTDYLVKLPDNKHIIIDSKVSLNAYVRLVSATDVVTEKKAMSEHITSVKKHIDDLASKDYTNLIGMHSPNFVLMFMPIEPAYIETLKHDSDIFGYAYKKNIVLVSHTTLIPILRTVSTLWMLEDSKRNTRQISEKAGDIFNSVCMLGERLQKLGVALNSVYNHYDGTVTSINGRQGLYGKVERFKQLSSKVSKDLPQLEPAYLSHDANKLNIQVVEVNEDPEIGPVDESTLANNLIKQEKLQNDSI